MALNRLLKGHCWQYEIRGQGHFLLPQLGPRDQGDPFYCFHMLVNDSKCITWIRLIQINYLG